MNDPPSLSFFSVLFRTRQGYLTFFLSLVAALNYADRSAFSAVFPPLRAELKISDAELGILASLFLWSYALISPVGGLLADRFSRSLLTIVSLVLWSSFMLLTGFANGFALLCICRIGLGLGEGPFHPAAFALIADHHVPIMRARAMSVLSLGFQFGIVAGGASAGFLAERLGWRAGFWILGGLGLFFALIARFFVADAPAVAETAAPPAARPAEAFRYLGRNFSFLLIVLKQILAEASTWIFTFWLPLYLYETFHLRLGTAGFAGTAMLSASLVAGIAVGGWLSDAVAKRDGRYRLMALGGCYILAAPFLLIFLARPSFLAVVVAVSAWSFLRGIGGASERPATCEVVPYPYRATAFGVLNTFASASGALGVLLAGVLKKGFGLNAVFASSSLLFAVTGSLLVLGTFVWMPRDMARARVAAAV